MDANNRRVTTVFKLIATSYFDGDHELNNSVSRVNGIFETLSFYFEEYV